MIGAAYRATGADWPYGDPGRAHGVAMEGYFWRITDRAAGRSLIALIGVNQGPNGAWATLGYGAHPTPFLRVAADSTAAADRHRLAARSGAAFSGDEGHVSVNLGPDARLDVDIDPTHRWPHRRFGGSSVFQSVPALNQYWHPWLLGGRVNGTAVVGAETWQLADAEIYAEKNWGKEGFPDSWWWGQAQGFDDDACVAFAGGEVTAGPLRTEVTALVVRLPDGTVLRQGNPLTSAVAAEVSDEAWTFRGRSRRLGDDWTIEVDAAAPLSAAHVLPVPMPSAQRNTAGAIEHLGGQLAVSVRRGSRLVWRGHSDLAGLEHGGLDRAERELRRRGVALGEVGAPPHRDE